MRRVVLFLVLLLVACSATTPRVLQRAGGGDVPFAFNGRIVILQDGGQRKQAGVRWTHRGEKDEVLLLSPLGQVVARIMSDAGEVLLEYDKKIYTAVDAETLTRDLLGWELPLSGLRYWLLAKPATAGEFRAERDAVGRIVVLYQQGWRINYVHYAAEAADALPLRINLQRDGVQAHLVIDEWEAY